MADWVGDCYDKLPMTVTLLSHPYTNILHTSLMDGLLFLLYLQFHQNVIQIKESCHFTLMSSVRAEYATLQNSVNVLPNLL